MITKEKVSLAFVDDDEELDRIPFVDVAYVKDSKVDALVDENGQAVLGVEIGTTTDGYNSGRTYHVRMSNNSNSAKLIKNLLINTRDAKRNQSSFFKRAQDRAHIIYHSDIIQSFFAFVIMAVRPSSGLPIDQRN